MRTLLRTFALSLILSFGCSQNAVAQSATDEEIANKAFPEPQLRAMLTGTLLNTKTFQISYVRLGKENVGAVLCPAIDRAVGTYLPQWSQNLVTAHRRHVPENELAKAVELTPAAWTRAMRPYAAQVGSEMQQASTPILQNAAKDVLAEVYAAASDVDVEPDLMTIETRMSELKRISVGTICPAPSVN